MPSLITAIYTLAEYLPFWGIPLALIFAEYANHSRKRHKKKNMVIGAVLSLTLIALIAAFFLFNGYSNTRPALKRVEREVF